MIDPKLSLSGQTTPKRENSINRMAWILLSAAGIAFFIQIIFWWEFTHDDAWISFRYAENLVTGRGFVFNPGERVEGYTNFLWTVLIAIPIALGLDPVPVSKILGIIFSIGTLAVLYRMVRRLLPAQPSFPLPAAAVLLLTAFAPFPFWAIGGLETAMFGFLAIAGLYLTLTELQNAPDQPSAAGFVLILSALTRPDGILFWAVGVFFIMVFTRKFRLQPLINWFVPFFTIYVPYFIWRWVYYGWLLPNTYYVRMGTDTAQSLELSMTGIQYWTSFILTHGSVPAAVLFLTGLFFTRFRGKSMLSAVLVLWVLHTTHAGGDEKPFGRLILPVLPVAVLFMIAGIETLTRRLKHHRVRFVVPASLLVLLIGFIHAGFYHPADRAYVKDHIFKYCQTSRKLGEWIRAHAAPNETMAARAIGAMGFYAKIPCFDLLGIVDEHIAHLPLEPGKLTAHGKSDLMHIIRKEPTYIAFMLMEPEKLGYRRFRVDLGGETPLILFRRDPALVPDPAYMANPRENQGLLLPWKP